MQPQDLAKLCYQAAFGAEHLLTDPSAAERAFYKEFDAVSPKDEPLTEPIAVGTVRVNLAAWKAHGMDAAWLWYLFSHSAVPLGMQEPVCETYIRCAMALVPSATAYLADYIRRGMPSLHHSDVYREHEHPAYRLVDDNLAPLVPILAAVAEKRPRVIAIDGRAAACKSTYAAYLADILGAPTVQMDDFFLPPPLRTKERLAAPGGNVHYERFAKEVLPHLGSAFAYRIFDCGVMDFRGEKAIPAAKTVIVEGAYSLHPHFGEYADLKLFFDVDSYTQAQRILARNGEKMAEMFRTRWIPMEEAYHKAFDTAARADLTVEI